jgi:hypothetical protein
MSVTMKPKALGLGAIAIVSGLGASLAAVPAAAGPVVIELFTSQGCSSCPPADAFLAELTGRDDVIPLSLHVDYWNYLGWADTFAQAAHTERQQRYSLARGDRQVYTPQMVVAGLWHVVGSDRDSVGELINAAKALPSVDLTVVWADGGLQLEVGDAVAGAPDRGTLWMIMFNDARTVAIGRGENAGRTITYYNVVVEMHRLAMWRGESMAIELPIAALSEVGADGCVIILQQDLAGGNPGQIIGAASYRRP